MRYCDTLLHARYIVTQNEQRDIHENASIAIADGRVADVGSRSEMDAAWRAKTTRDLGEAVVLPGLVNAHTHAAMTFLRGLADDMPLMQWLAERVFPVEARLTAEIVHISSLMGYAEMLAAGTTACMDMYIFENAALEAARTAGLRCLGGEAVFNFPSAACPDWQSALDATSDMARELADDPRLGVTVTPHSVYTTSREILAACRDAAMRLNIPLHIHLAETREETAQSLDLHGMRPVALCAGLGLFDIPCTLAHMVDVTEAELDLLTAFPNVAVAHNPSSNMKLASGAAPVAAMLQKGIAVGLGTDGPASNNRLNMFTEMGRAALLQKLSNRDPTLLSAETVFDMATLGGAAALHRHGIGSLAPGNEADLAALDLSAPNLQPLYRPISHLAYAAGGHETVLTMVAGEILYENGRFTRFDYDALRAEMQNLRDFVLRHAGLA